MLYIPHFLPFVNQYLLQNQDKHPHEQIGKKAAAKPDIQKTPFVPQALQQPIHCIYGS